MSEAELIQKYRDCKRSMYQARNRRDRAVFMVLMRWAIVEIRRKRKETTAATVVSH